MSRRRHTPTPPSPTPCCCSKLASFCVGSVCFPSSARIDGSNNKTLKQTWSAIDEPLPSLPAILKSLSVSKEFAGRLCEETREALSSLSKHRRNNAARVTARCSCCESVLWRRANQTDLISHLHLEFPLFTCFHPSSEKYNNVGRNENRKWKAGVCSLLVLSCHFLKRLIVWRLVFVVPSGEQRCHVYLPNVVMTDEDEGHKAAELSFKCQRLSRTSSFHFILKTNIQSWRVP